MPARLASSFSGIMNLLTLTAAVRAPDLRPRRPEPEHSDLIGLAAITALLYASLGFSTTCGRAS
jgi:hypothetical protein